MVNARMVSARIEPQPRAFKWAGAKEDEGFKARTVEKTRAWKVSLRMPTILSMGLDEEVQTEVWCEPAK